MTPPKTNQTNVQQYIEQHGLQALQEEFAIKVREYDDRVVLNYDQIKSPRFHPICDECRALILRKPDFSVMSRAFDRFYNVGEGEGWEDFPIQQSRIYSKIDGSLMSVYWDGNEWCVSTRSMAFAEGTLSNGVKTFRQLFDEAEAKTNVFGFLRKHQDEMHEGTKRNTWLFELTSPESRIVTPHKESSLTLLAAREPKTGLEMYGTVLDHFAQEMEVARPRSFKFSSLDEAIENAKELDIMDEGFVLTFEQPGAFRRLKCKNENFLAIAHMRGNGAISPRRVLALVMNNEQFEYLGYFECDKKYFDFVEKVYDDAANRIRQLHTELAGIEDQKEFALTMMPKTKHAFEKGVLFTARKTGDIEGALKELEPKKIAKTMNLRELFAKEFGIEVEDEEE